MDNLKNPDDTPPKVALSPPSVPESNSPTSPPITRDSSPSPSIFPTPALFACPPLGRSFSATSSSDYSTSSASTISQQSVTSRSSSASAALRQRGYVRPQGVAFAPSAGNRDSVLSLGSIAHLQYYFARTGLLDGKGGQLAKERKPNQVLDRTSQETLPRIYAPPDFASTTVDSPISVNGTEASEKELDEPLMLPPTVSTYSHRVQYIPPPPDAETLRQDLTSALLEAKKALQQVTDEGKGPGIERDLIASDPSIGGHHDLSPSFSQPSGWYEIQGLHILDVVTLAIRAAKIYYTSHEDPHRLYGIKSERQIREELLGVLDVLKRMAGRNFAGGMRDEELRVIKTWITSIEAFVAKEQALEKQEAKERESWSWLEGNWEGLDRNREWVFLNSFYVGELPEWTAVGASDLEPSPFLDMLRTGLELVHLHNALLKKSKRQFGEIKTFHIDTAKPYRCAENLRYWIKAAEIRWETKLKVNVLGVVNSKEEAWPDFDAAILQWSKAVREELTKEWKEAEVRCLQPTHYPTYPESEAVELTTESRNS